MGFTARVQEERRKELRSLPRRNREESRLGKPDAARARFVSLSLRLLLSCHSYHPRHLSRSLFCCHVWEKQGLLLSLEDFSFRRRDVGLITQSRPEFRILGSGLG